MLQRNCCGRHLRLTDVFTIWVPKQTIKSKPENLSVRIKNCQSHSTFKNKSTTTRLYIKSLYIIVHFIGVCKAKLWKLAYSHVHSVSEKLCKIISIITLSNIHQL